MFLHFMYNRAILLSMEYWDKAIHSVYGSLLDSVKCDIGQPSSGSVVKSTSKGHEYLQHRISYAGTPLSLPIRQPEVHTEGWPHRQRLVSTLIASGANPPDGQAAKAFELLDAIGCFALQKSILIGSHAFNAIGNNLGVTWDAGIETKDIDLGRMIKVSCPPSHKTAEILVKAGFRAIPQLNRKYPPTNFIHKNGMKVDFLTPMAGKPDHKPVLLQGAGVYAEPLRFLDYLIKEPQEAVVLTRNGVLVSVPQSARYALHKCVIYQYRRDDAKREKDLLQAESILTVLEDRMPHLIINVWRDLPWKDKAMVGISELKDKELTERLRALIDAVPG